jgi:hypothetical protein
MTALQCTLHPFEATIDLQADIAVDRLLHPDSVQSVPIEEFGLSQKLSVTEQLFGVMTASLVMPSDSSGVAPSEDGDDGDDASVFLLETSPVALPGSGVDSSAHAYTVTSDATTRLLIRPKPFMTSSSARRSRWPSWISLPRPRRDCAGPDAKSHDKP